MAETQVFFFLTPALNWKLVYVYARSHSYVLVISIAISTQPLVFNFVSSCIPKVVARRYTFHPLSGWIVLKVLQSLFSLKKKCNKLYKNYRKFNILHENVFQSKLTLLWYKTYLHGSDIQLRWITVLILRYLCLCQ